MSSKIRDARTTLKQAIIDSGLFAEDAIIIERKALSLAKHKMICVIGVGRGKNLHPMDGLIFDCDYTIGIWCHTVADIAADPEEEVWEELIKVIRAFGGPTLHCHDKWRVEDFEDIEIEPEPGMTKGLLARQTTIRRKIAIY